MVFTLVLARSACANLAGLRDESMHGMLYVCTAYICRILTLVYSGLTSDYIQRTSLHDSCNQSYLPVQYRWTSVSTFLFSLFRTGVVGGAVAQKIWYLEAWRSNELRSWLVHWSLILLGFWILCFSNRGLGSFVFHHSPLISLFTTLKVNNPMHWI